MKAKSAFVQNYFVEDEQLRWREGENLPPATLFINLPYDPEAHRGKKRTTLWTGYKVHLTETCEQALPHFITQVATTPAPKTDEAMTERIQEKLHQAEIPPGEHFVDAGYASARRLVTSQERFGIEMVCPSPLTRNGKPGPDLALMRVSLPLIGSADKQPARREKRVPVGVGSAARAILT